MIPYLKAVTNIICLHYHLSVSVFGLLFEGVFPCFLIFSMYFAPKIEGKGLGALSLCFCHSWRVFTQVAPPHQPHGVSLVLNSQTGSWEQSYFDISISKVCCVGPVVSIFSVTISKQLLSRSQKSSSGFWKGENLLRKLELKRNLTSQGYFNCPTELMENHAELLKTPGDQYHPYYILYDLILGNWASAIKLDLLDVKIFVIV